MRGSAIALCLVVALAVSGCGSGGDGETQQSTSATAGTVQGQEEPAAKSEGQGRPQKAERSRGAPHSQRKQGSGGSTAEAEPDPQTRRVRAQRLHQNFPKPAPAPEAKQTSDKVIAAGEEACRGMTPAEVKARFYAQAQANLDPDQRRLIEELPKYEEEAQRDPSFVAGQIAATVYAATLPETQHDYGFQGCVYELARGLSQELSTGR